MLVVTLVGDDGSLGNSKEVNLLVLRELVGVLTNGIDILGLEDIWEIDNTTAYLLTILVFEGVFIGLSYFDLREPILLLFGLSG